MMQRLRYYFWSAYDFVVGWSFALTAIFLYYTIYQLPFVRKWLDNQEAKYRTKEK